MRMQTARSLIEVELVLVMFALRSLSAQLLPLGHHKCDD